MKKRTVIDTRKARVGGGSRLAYALYMASHKFLARHVLRKSRAECVLYGIVYDERGGKPSCHLIAPQPCDKAYIRKCFPRTGSAGRPLVLYAK